MQWQVWYVNKYEDDAILPSVSSTLKNDSGTSISFERDNNTWNISRVSLLAINYWGIRILPEENWLHLVSWPGTSWSWEQCRLKCWEYPFCADYLFWRCYALQGPMQTNVPPLLCRRLGHPPQTVRYLLCQPLRLYVLKPGTPEWTSFTTGTEVEHLKPELAMMKELLAKGRQPGDTYPMATISNSAWELLLARRKLE